MIMMRKNNITMTLLADANSDLRARIHGECSLHGGRICVNSWLKAGSPHGVPAAAQGVVDDKGQWEICDFLLVDPVCFSEKARTCCIQAIVLDVATGQTIHQMLEVELSIPYVVEGQLLKVSTYNALVSALHVAETGERSPVVSLMNDLVVQYPVEAAVTCELQGQQHTLTCIVPWWENCLFDRIGEKGVVKGLKVNYPDWLPKDKFQGKDGFAGIVRELKGRIEDCEVAFDMELGVLPGGGIALEARAGSVIKKCRVKSRMKGKSVGGVVFRLEQGTIDGCEVDANLDFQEYGGGIACRVEGKDSRIDNCFYKGTLSCGGATCASSRKTGGIAAWVEKDTRINACRAEVDFDLERSGFGGYAGGVAGQCSHSEIGRCGVILKMNPHWRWLCGGIAGLLADSAKVSECAVYEKEKMSGGESVIGGLVGEIGAQCQVSDSYASLFLQTSTYAGGLVGYASPVSTGATVERCYCTAGLDVKAGGGIKQRSGVKVGHCAAIHSYLAATGEMGRVGLGGNVDACIAFNGTQTAPGKQITATGETLHDAKSFFDQATFAALGWDFTKVWQMDDAGYPKLRQVNGGQYYTYPFLRMTPPASGDTYRFKQDETVCFSGRVHPLAVFKSATIKPEDCAASPLSEVGGVVITGDQWTFAVGRLVARKYNVTFVHIIDGGEFTTSASVVVEL